MKRALEDNSDSTTTTQTPAVMNEQNHAHTASQRSYQVNKKQRLSSSGSKSNPDNLKQACLQIWTTLKQHRDENKRQLAKLFLALPSKKLYPDYYQVIERPISLDMIRQKVERQEYISLNEFHDDMELCFSNARHYNMEESEVYQDATVLSELLRGEIQANFSSMATHLKTPKAGKAKVKAPWTKEDTLKLTKAVNSGDLASLEQLASVPGFDPNMVIDGEESTWPLLHAAAYHGHQKAVEFLLKYPVLQLNSRDVTFEGTALAWAAYAGHFEIANALIVAGADPTLKNKQGQRPFDLVPVPVDPKWNRLLLPKHEKGSQLPKTPERSSSSSSSAPANNEELATISEVLESLKQAQDRGASLCEFFLELPSKEDYPDYYDVITKPICLTMIQERIAERDYSDLSQFENDLMQMFENAFTYNEDESPIYKDATMLKECYLKIKKRKLKNSHSRVSLAGGSLLFEKNNKTSSTDKECHTAQEEAVDVMDTEPDVEPTLVEQISIVSVDDPTVTFMTFSPKIWLRACCVQLAADVDAVFIRVSLNPECQSTLSLTSSNSSGVKVYPVLKDERKSTSQARFAVDISRGTNVFELIVSSNGHFEQEQAFEVVILK